MDCQEQEQLPGQKLDDGGLDKVGNSGDLEKWMDSEHIQEQNLQDLLMEQNVWKGSRKGGVKDDFQMERKAVASGLLVAISKAGIHPVGNLVYICSFTPTRLCYPAQLSQYYIFFLNLCQHEK